MEAIERPSMKPKELNELGIPRGRATRAAIAAVRRLAGAGRKREEIAATLAAVVERPLTFTEDPECGELARVLEKIGPGAGPFRERSEPAPYRQWGRDLEPQSVQQMENACRLPVAVRGALMPDAHLGYGLPIGGVLATEASVIPYAVGVDIACRMKMTALDLPIEILDEGEERLRRAIHRVLPHHQSQERTRSQPL